MKNYKQILVLFNKKELRRLTFLFFGLLLMGIIEVVGVISIAPFMAVVTSPSIIHENIYLSTAFNYFKFSNNYEFIKMMGIFVIIILAFSNAYSAYIRWMTVKIVQIHGHSLSTRLLSQYLSRPYVFYLTNNTNDLGKNILSEVGRVINGVIMPAMTAISKLVIVIFILTLLVIINPLLALSTGVVLGGAYLLTYKLVRNRLHEIGIDSTKMVSQRFKIANEAMSGIKEVKLKGAEKEFIRRYIEPSMADAKYTTQSTIISELPRYLLETLAFGGIVAIVIYLLSIDNNTGNVVPLISLYAMAGLRLMPALQYMFQGMARARYNYPAMQILIDDLADYDSSNIMSKKQSKIISFNNLLELRKVKFFYPRTTTAVIEELDLKISANTTVGFVGTTGSGKTTLIDILLGLLKPQSGTFLIDGVEIREQNLHSWQINLGYVPQSIYLTDDTIENNIAFAVNNDEIDRNKVIRAAKIAELDEFINTLLDGYQTYVGERGVRLSGGQKQRIGIARALYNNPKVLILDEATSALDGITENIIMNTINNLSHKRTIIMIAHRLSTVRECDVIFLMEEGKIIDSGSYDELLGRNSKFNKMASEIR